MQDQNKTKAQLVAELRVLRQRMAELEALEVERKRAEEEIRRAKEEWEWTFDAMPDLIAILDNEQRIVRSNKAMTGGLGVSRVELVGTKCYHCFHSAEKPPLSCPFIPMLQDGQTHSEEVYVERVGRDFLVTTSPLRDAKGRVSGCVHVARDITDRKQAEAALRESEEKYRTLFETMVQGVVYQDAEGRITSANPAAERILGLTLDQMQGRTSLDPRWKAIHEDGSDFSGETHPAMVALKTGTQVKNVVMGVFDPRREEYRWIKVDAVPQFRPVEDKPYQVYTTFDDITQRKRAEEALEERMRFETLLADLTATLVNLPVSQVDQAIQRGLGQIVEFLHVDRGTLYEFSEGQTKLYHIHSYARLGVPPTPAMVTVEEFPWYIGRLRQGEIVLIERIDDLPAEATRDKESALQMGKSNLAIPLTVGGATLGVIAFGSVRHERAWPRDLVPRLKLIGEILANVLARKRAEEGLARHDREMAALYATSLEINLQPDVSALLHAIVRRAVGLLEAPMGGLYLMRPDGQALELVVSHNLLRDYTGTILHLGEGLSGRIAQTGRPMMVDDHLHWEGRAGVYADIQTRRVLGVPLKVGERVVGVINVADDQKVGPFDEDQVRLLSLFADQAAIAVENARLVEALRRSNVDLQARNEELDAFAHTVAHDLKTPVGPVVGFAEILARDYAAMSEDERQQSLRAIVRNGRKMNTIIEELLLLAQVRKTEVETTPLDMAAIVSEVQQRMADIVEQSHAEVILPDASAWPVALGYALWVEEVWINYLGNAITYGGRPPHIELGAEMQPGGMVRFWVHDNGPGIPPEAQARLFKPFTRLDQVCTTGHGLGLSIVRRIVDKLGGQVGMTSAPGQGSVFSFTLPGAAGPPQGR